MNNSLISTRIDPEGHLDLLSKLEVAKLLDTSQGDFHTLFRNCSLAVLNYSSHLDDATEMLKQFKSFDIRVIQQERGIKLEVKNAPADAFVDGKIIRGINEHLFAVLRDIIYVNDTIMNNSKFDLNSSADTTNAIFHILRNANILRAHTKPKIVVCWGGHSISRKEYDYTKEIGYQMGLRELNICTGCGPGAMKGPMKGATFGHAKQRILNGQYLGISEPGIIAAESPNPIVNELVIMPDIEKRLEAFVRTGHGIIVFPGGAGTTEEILYILSILLHPENKYIPFPLIFTAPESSREYFIKIDQFIVNTLGEAAQHCYEIIINDPEKVARAMQKSIQQVYRFRHDNDDAYYFNWLLKIDRILQQPFQPTHKNMNNLALHKNQQPYKLAANLRCAFSGIVAGNVKEEGIRAIEKHGVFELKGDASIMQDMNELLQSFVEQQRMKLAGSTYNPCYTIIH